MMAPFLSSGTLCRPGNESNGWSGGTILGEKSRKRVLCLFKYFYYLMINEFKETISHIFENSFR